MKIIADTAVCIGAGQCALVAGELFDQDDDGIVLVLNDEPAENQKASARRAASLCPSRAITIVDSE